MLNFLRQSRKFLNAKEHCCIVLGNESCDLDSAVSAVSLAYFYHKSKLAPKSCRNGCNFLPILNIPRRDYPLKTEVHYLFKQYNIGDDLLTFRDELTEEFMKENNLVLVDHHVSPVLKNAVAIYDHRPKDAMANFPENCDINIQIVGSCASLIAELFIQNNILGGEEQMALELLRSAIVLDTVNFSEEAARATPKDVDICSKLESTLEILNPSLLPRADLFNNLVKARSDVSALTPAQLLRKDLKIITSKKDGNLKIALPGFPLPVQEFIMKSNASQYVQQFAEENSCQIILLMGMYVKPEDNSVHRDLGLINIENATLFVDIKEKLEHSEEPKLLLKLHEDCKFMSGVFYKQDNIKATRKHILPIVKVFR
ncbi:exopolyphosphatase PRUNE1 [Musca domestica]|uniref:Exopolyphosphatase PRUNE1 n=1 Tax=Musca domestica TaxID=7370 RepID=A0A9J7IH47_MUSDO|nr:exopolyphosphatase PRUNE1 [Musca domestica]XP_019892840.2 exopolyphosphatase PRUNE1 [Musca domestica]